MKMHKYNVELTYEELLLIDGKVSVEVQAAINLAKLDYDRRFKLPIMNEILNKSEATGELKWTLKSIKSCNFCDKAVDYARYPRNSRYHNKGDYNYDKPRYYSGIAFNERFVSINGRGDMCTECCENHQVIKTLVNYIIDNDLKIEIRKNEFAETKYKKDAIRICYDCKKEMNESEMGRERALMGGGTFPSECPHCHAKALPLGSTHRNTGKFDFVLNNSK